MTPQFLMLVVLASAAFAERRYGYSSLEESYEYGPAKYQFEWSVDDEESGNKYGHEEERDDDHTKGQYYVYLPDYRKKTVTYYVDGDSGFVAEVEYDGDGQYSDESNEYQHPRHYYRGNSHYDDHDDDDDDDDHDDYEPPRHYHFG